MSEVFKKLKLGAQTTIHVLNAPASFEAELAALEGVRVARTVSPATRTGFALGFAVTQTELDALSSKLVKAAEGDALLWIAYPKGSSRKYRCEFNRDSGWAVLGAAGFEPVRMVAIDDDWSALRFRRAAHIKSMTRDPARRISNVGQQRTG